MYRALEPDKIVATLDKLKERIEARFPNSGLSKVADELCAIARATIDRADKLSKPYLWLRALSGLAIVAGLVVQFWILGAIHPQAAAMSFVDLAQGLEAAVNLLALMGAAVWFLITVEVRIKRGSALQALHELRSLAHVIDMHQLTKDPTMVLAAQHQTAVSPERGMSEFELVRYLDYCAEMLALTGKLAALYAGQSGDGVVIDAVNEIENLTANLGRKIWQKITIISQLDEAKA